MSHAIFYVPKTSPPLDTDCAFRVCFTEHDHQRTQSELKALFHAGSVHVSQLAAADVKREGMAYYETLIAGVPHVWRAYSEMWLEFFQSAYGMFTHRETVGIRRYQLTQKYHARLHINGNTYDRTYASQRELVQDIGDNRPTN